MSCTSMSYDLPFPVLKITTVSIEKIPTMQQVNGTNSVPVATYGIDGTINWLTNLEVGLLMISQLILSFIPQNLVVIM